MLEKEKRLDTERKRFKKGQHVKMAEPIDEQCLGCKEDCIMCGGKGIIKIDKDNVIRVGLYNAPCQSAFWDSEWFEVVPIYSWKKL